MVRTTRRCALRECGTDFRKVTSIAVVTALNVVWTSGRCQIRGAAAGTCRVTSDSEQPLQPALRQQAVFLWGLPHGDVVGFKVRV